MIVLQMIIYTVVDKKLNLKALILILLVCLPGFIYAQQTVSYTGQHVEYRIPYRTNGAEIYVFGNSVLREMAKDVLREPWLVQIRISCDLGFAITRDGDTSRLFISMARPAVTGDTVYRHFPITGFLFPSRISMKLRWANRADTSGYVEELLAGKPLQPADSLICSIPVASFNPMVDTLIVREVDLFYDSLALRKFLDRIELIHDYYASVLLLDSLLDFTGNLRHDQPELLPYNCLKAQELSRVLARIESRDFPGQLLRNGYDSRGLMVKYRQMFRLSRSLVYNLVDEMHKTGVIPWDGNVDRVAEYVTSRVLSYVRRSYLMDQQQGRIYGDCLDHFFDESAFPPGENLAGPILTKMFPSAAQDTLAHFVSKRIYASYRTTAQQLINQRQYAEAFSVMENGCRFVAGIPVMKGVETDELLQSQAAEGICNSYIGIASTCINSHKYGMADTYLAKADQYAVTHAKFIRSDSVYRAVFSELFFLRNADCDDLLSREKYAEALECYQQFEKDYSPRDLALVSTRLNEKKSMAMTGLGNISATLSEDALKRKDADTALYYYEKAIALRQDGGEAKPANAALDSLAPVMARIKWQQIFREGAIALEKRQYTLAVNRLKEAKLLAATYRFDGSREFDSTYRQAVKYYLIVQLSASQKKIWDNQFDSAQASLQRTEATGYDFGLLNEPDLISAIDHYKLKILEQQCRNQQDSVDLRLIRVDRSVALRSYINALAYLKEALALVRFMPPCGIDEKPVVDSIEKYNPPASYQKEQLRVNSLVAAGNYDEAVQGLVDNQEVFHTQQLNRFGIQMVGSYEFFRDRENPYLTGKAMAFYLGKSNDAAALRLLQLAHEQGLPPLNAALVQKELGSKLAQKDYLDRPQGDLPENVEKYIPADAWFDAFRASYTAEWNRLAKANLKGTK